MQFNLPVKIEFEFTIQSAGKLTLAFNGWEFTNGYFRYRMRTDNGNPWQFQSGGTSEKPILINEFNAGQPYKLSAIFGQTQAKFYIDDKLYAYAAYEKSKVDQSGEFNIKPEGTSATIKDVKITQLQLVFEWPAQLRITSDLTSDLVTYKGSVTKVCGESDIYKLLSETLLIFDTTSDECGLFCEANRVTLDGVNLLNEPVTAPVTVEILARVSEGCLFIFAIKKQHFYVSTREGADTDNLEIQFSDIQSVSGQKITFNSTEFEILTCPLYEFQDGSGCVQGTCAANQVLQEDGITCIQCPDYQVHHSADIRFCVEGTCQMKDKLMVDGTCSPCPDYQLHDSADSTTCVEGTCQLKYKLLVDGTCSPCPDYEIQDPNDSKSCHKGECTEERTKLEKDGETCTPCDPYQITDPMDVTQCKYPDCPEDQIASENGTCYDDPSLQDVEVMSFIPAPLFPDYIEPIEILVNPMNDDFQEEINVNNYVDLHNNMAEDVKITLVSGLNDTFMAWDKDTNTITFNELGVDNIGNYSISLKVQNKDGASNEAVFIIEIKNEIENAEIQQPAYQPNQPMSNDATLEPEVSVAKIQEQIPKRDEEVQPVLAARIIKLNYFGELEAQIRQSEFPIDVNLIEQKHLDLKFDPAKERFDEEDFDLETLGYDWELLSNDNGNLKFQVDFHNPSQISLSQTQDYLDLYIFISAEERLRITKGNRELKFANQEGELEYIQDIDLKLKVAIKPQLENSPLLRNYDKQTGHVSEVISKFCVVNFLLLYIITKALGPAVLWIHVMQLITHYQLLSTRFPANVSLFHHFTFMIVNFDAIPPDYSTDLVFDYQEYHTESYLRQFDYWVTPQMQDLGYGSNSLIRNCGSVFIFICLYLALATIWYPLSSAICQCKSKRLKVCRVYPRQLKRALFYDQIITILVESYMTITISALINIKFPSKETLGEVLGVTFGFLLSVLCVLVIPSFLTYMFKHTKEELLLFNAFRRKYGAFYNTFKTSSKGTMMAYTVYIFRRLLFVILCFLLNSLPGCQIQAILFLNLICSIYYGHYLPMRTPIENFIQLFNEFMAQLICATILQFTHSTKDIDLWGWLYVSQIVFMTIVNLLITFWLQAKEVYIWLQATANCIALNRKCAKNDPEQATRTDPIAESDNKKEEENSSGLLGAEIKQDPSLKEDRLIERKEKIRRLNVIRFLETRQQIKGGQKQWITDLAVDNIVSKLVSAELSVSNTEVKKNQVEKLKAQKKKDEGQKQTEQEKNRHEALMGLRNKNQLQTIHEEENVLIDLKQNTNQKSLKERAITKKTQKGILNSHQQHELQEKLQKLQDAVRNSQEKQMVAKLDQEITVNELTLAFNEFNREFKFNLTMMKKENEKLKELEKKKEECQKYLPWDDFDENCDKKEAEKLKKLEKKTKECQKYLPWDDFDEN